MTSSKDLNSKKPNKNTFLVIADISRDYKLFFNFDFFVYSLKIIKQIIPVANSGCFVDVVDAVAD